MAYGTETIPKVDVIVGPGNRYVNAAKRIVYGEVGIDMLAGPSEVCIIADSESNPEYVAADLLAQLEHGNDNFGVVITDSEDMIKAVNKEVSEMLLNATRSEILEHTLSKSLLIKSRSLDEAVDLANIMSPEHLELQVRDPMSLLPRVKNAGAVLMGDYSGAALGDYVAGPSHTLPTAGTARFSSPLSAATFIKRTSVIWYTENGAKQASETASQFAVSEGFPAHNISANSRNSN
jgi:histidinol dehydrogenase